MFEFLVNAYIIMSIRIKHITIDVLLCNTHTKMCRVRLYLDANHNGQHPKTGLSRVVFRYNILYYVLSPARAYRITLFFNAPQ